MRAEQKIIHYSQALAQLSNTCRDITASVGELQLPVEKPLKVYRADKQFLQPDPNLMSIQVYMLLKHDIVYIWLPYIQTDTVTPDHSGTSTHAVSYIPF